MSKIIWYNRNIIEGSIIYTKTKLSVYTYIIEYKFLWFTWYRIKQSIPKLKYDNYIYTDIHTKNLVKITAFDDYQNAYRLLNDLKRNGIQKD